MTTDDKSEELKRDTNYVKDALMYVRLLRQTDGLPMAVAAPGFCFGVATYGKTTVDMLARWKTDREGLIDEALAVPAKFKAFIDHAQTLAGPMPQDAKEAFNEAFGKIDEVVRLPNVREVFGEFLDDAIKHGEQKGLTPSPDEMPDAIRQVVEGLSAIPGVKVSAQRIDVLPGETPEQALRRVTGKGLEDVIDITDRVNGAGPQVPPEAPVCVQSDLLLAAKQLNRVVDMLYADMIRANKSFKPTEHPTWALTMEALRVVEREEAKALAAVVPAFTEEKDKS